MILGLQASAQSTEPHQIGLCFQFLNGCFSPSNALTKEEALVEDGKRELDLVDEVTSLSPELKQGNH